MDINQSRRYTIMIKNFSRTHLRNSIMLIALSLGFGCASAVPDSPSAPAAEEISRVKFEQYSYSGVYLDISNETENARATHWKPDGTELYITGRYTENVVNYSVSEPWNIGTATYRNEFSVSGETGSTDQQSVPHGLFLRDDGAKMWVFNRTEMWGYNLETAWDVSTAEKGYYIYLGEHVQRGHDFDFNPEGTRLFIDDRNAQAVHEYHLSAPWDITTAEWVYSLDISDQEQEVRGLEMVLGGTIMLLMDTVRQEILQYHLTEPYNLRTARFLDAFDVSAQAVQPRGLSVHPELKYIYVTGRDHQEVYQYSRD
jgi:DNA-binding beta-propeller fold protein YncE